MTWMAPLGFFLLVCLWGSIRTHAALEAAQITSKIQELFDQTLERTKARLSEPSSHKIETLQPVILELKEDLLGLYPKRQPPASVLDPLSELGALAVKSEADQASALLALKAYFQNLMEDSLSAQEKALQRLHSAALSLMFFLVALLSSTMIYLYATGGDKPSEASAPIDLSLLPPHPSILMLRMSRSGEVQQINQAMLPHALHSESPWGSIHHYFYEDSCQEIRRALTTSAPFLGPLSLRSLKGLVRVDAAITPLSQRGSGDFLLMGVDVTKSHELAQLTHEMQRIARIGAFYYHCPSKGLTWTKGVYELLKLSFDPPITLAKAESYLLGEDRYRFQRVFQEAIRTGKSFHQEFEVETKEGPKWVMIRGSGRKDPLGQITHVVGTYQDITLERQRIQQEEALTRLHDPFVKGVDDFPGFLEAISDELKNLSKSHGGLIALSHDAKDASDRDITSLYRFLAHGQDASFEDLTPFYLELSSQCQQLIKRQLLHLEHSSVPSPPTWPDAFGITGHLVSLPLIQGERALGTILLAKRDPFTTEHIAFLLPLIERIGDMVGHLLLAYQTKTRERERRLLLEGAGLGLFSFFPKTKTMVWDESLYHLFKIPPMPDQDLYQIWLLELDEVTREEMVPLLESPPKPYWPFEFQFQRCQDGTTRTYKVRAEIIKDDSHKAHQIFAVVFDVTREVSMRQDLEHQRRLTLRQAKLASIGELAAGVGHEINNPLSVIKGFAHTLAQKAKDQSLNPGNGAQYLDKMLLAIDQIDVIVSELRSFSREDPAASEDFDPISALDHSIKLLKDIYEKDGVHLECFLETKKGEFLLTGFRGRLQQVVMNLLANAKDAVENSKEKVIQVSALCKEHQLIIRVKDTGHGIPEGICEKIFDPFFTTKGLKKGTGIGLALVHSFILEMKGSIALEKTSPQGTSFLIHLPVRYAPHETLKSLPQDLVMTPPSFRFKTMLVDDEPSVREVLESLLTPMGLEITSVGSAQSALKLLREASEPFDLVISDMKMPGLDGPHFLKELRSDPHLHQPYFLFITGGLHVQFDDKQMNQWFDGFFFKPFKEDKIIAILLELSERKGRGVA